MPERINVSLIRFFGASWKAELKLKSSGYYQRFYGTGKIPTIEQILDAATGGIITENTVGFTIKAEYLNGEQA